MSQDIDSAELDKEAEGGEIQSPQETETHDEPSYEDRAKGMGWVPKEQFRGDPERWVDAEQFVKRGENELPILRERLRKYDSEIREMRQTFDEFKKYASEKEKRAVERAIKEVERKREEAVQTGDVDAFKEADTEYQTLREEMGKHKDAPQAPEVPAEIVAWKERNKWFDTDPEAADYAIVVDNRVRRENPTLTDAEALTKVTEAVRKRFPEHFENPRRNQPSAVEGGQSLGRGKGKKGYGDLPADAKAACDKFVKNGLMTREQYLADYFQE